MNQISSRKGFTLIELIVVISIIVMVSSVTLYIGKPGLGQALSSSQRIVLGMIQGARTKAVAKSSTVRLIIHNDPEEIDKYRRFFGMVVYQKDNNSSTLNVDEKGWVALNQGTYLPKGIYFDADSSALKSSSTVWSNSMNSMKLEFPLLTPQDGSSDGNDYYYYEFSSNGTTRSANAWLVLRAATMIPGDTKVEELKVNKDQEFVRVALILRRSGGVTMVTNPDVLESLEDGVL